MTFTAVLEANVKVAVPKRVLHNWKDKPDTRDEKRDALRLFHMTYHNSPLIPASSPTFNSRVLLALQSALISRM